jgi:uncharacterized protein (TIGR02646 family)
MRYIKKESCPPSLTKWIAMNRSLPNFEYSSLPGEVKEDLKRALLLEQGYLCAYTGLRIEEGTHHIEHMISQATCLAAGKPERTVDYHNIVACYPGAHDPNPGFGALHKDQKENWPAIGEESNFLKPTDATCEARLRYLDNGGIRAENPGDYSAAITIAKLNLKDQALVRLRREALLALWNYPGKQITKVGIKRRLLRIDLMPDGKLEQFSFVKKQYLQRKMKQQS